MSCGCGNSPCKPQKPRCKCQNDCWKSESGSYAICLAGCNKDCGFPLAPGFPSQGYRCPDHPAPDYISCSNECSDNEQSALISCQSSYDSCVSSASEPGQEEACSSIKCGCDGAAIEERFKCERDCDASHAFPQALTCAAAEVISDQLCCNVDLSDCYEPCEIAYLTEMAPIEAAWIDCIKIRNGVGAEWVPSTETDLGYCRTFYNPDYDYCNARRFLDSAEIRKANRICRAVCEGIEMRRDEPEDRKRAECGSYYHECYSRCGASVEEERATCWVNYELCWNSAKTLDDYVACGDGYRSCNYNIDVTQIGCRVECCKKDAHNVRHKHARSDHYFDCYKHRLQSLLVCNSTYDRCWRSCGSDSSCQDACQSAYCTCEGIAILAYQNCITDSPRGDCPDCFSKTITDLDLENPSGAENPGGGGSSSRKGPGTMPVPSNCITE